MQHKLATSVHKPLTGQVLSTLAWYSYAMLVFPQIVQLHVKYQRHNKSDLLYIVLLQIQVYWNLWLL